MKPRCAEPWARVLRDGLYMVTDAMVARGPSAERLRLLFWTFLLAFIAQQIFSEIRFGAPVQLLALQLIPLLIFLPGVARDNLRSFIWLSFVQLAYFVSAVLALFAQPGDLISIAGVVLIVLLFTVTALYVRFRGREQRGSQSQSAIKKEDP